MEQGIPPHQQGSSEGALVPLESYTLPLLPFERDLIAQLGVSEEEYRDFAAEVSSRIRYDQLEGVPTNDAVLTPILINLAIGLLLTGVSMLLAPKPQRPDDKKQQNLRINEDFSKSYTHERPAPDTNPPTSRATSTESRIKVKGFNRTVIYDSVDNETVKSESVNIGEIDIQNQSDTEAKKTLIDILSQLGLNK